MFEKWKMSKIEFVNSVVQNIALHWRHFVPFWWFGDALIIFPSREGGQMIIFLLIGHIKSQQDKCYYLLTLEVSIQIHRGRCWLEFLAVENKYSRYWERRFCGWEWWYLAIGHFIKSLCINFRIYASNSKK